MSRYSNDLRKKVIDYFNLGNSKSKTSDIFNISRQTLDFWIKLDKEDKLFEIKKYQHGFKSSVDLDEFKRYVDENSDKYYHEIAKEFKIKKSQAHRIVKTKLNYTVKKNKQSTEKQIKKLKKSLNNK